MSTFLVTLGILLSLGLVTFAPTLADLTAFHNRLAFWTAGAGLLLAVAMPNPWLQGLIAASSVNLMLRPYPSQPLKDSYYWALALGALIVCVVPLVGAFTVTGFLYGLVAIGLGQTVYTYWDQNASQGNPMHVQALAAVSAAAAVGLGLHTSPFLLAVLPILWPILAVQWRDVRLEAQAVKMTLGPLYGLAIVVGALYLYLGWIVVLGASVAFLGAFLWAWPKTMLWSGRKEWWTAAVIFWWEKSAWWQKLLGFGADAWVVFSQQYIGEIKAVSRRHVPEGFEGIVMPHLHNDYLQTLFDRGLIGLGCLLGYLVTSLYMLAQAGPDGQALFLVGLTLCAIAFGAFPWTGCVVTYIPDMKRLAGYGCPALNFISWVVIILVEAVRHGL